MHAAGVPAACAQDMQASSTPLHVHALAMLAPRAAAVICTPASHNPLSYMLENSKGYALAWEHTSNAERHKLSCMAKLTGTWLGLRPSQKPEGIAQARLHMQQRT